MNIYTKIGIIQIKKTQLSILHNCISGQSRPVRIPDGPIAARYSFNQNGNWGRSRKTNTHTNMERSVSGLLRGVEINSDTFNQSRPPIPCV